MSINNLKGIKFQGHTEGIVDDSRQMLIKSWKKKGRIMGVE
jgi:hypothetical protein